MAHESRIRTVQQKEAERRRVRRNRGMLAAVALSTGVLAGAAMSKLADHQLRNAPTAESFSEDEKSIVRENITSQLLNGGEIECMSGKITFANNREQYGADVSGITLDNPIVVQKEGTEGTSIKDFYFAAAAIDPSETAENVVLFLFDGAVDEYEGLQGAAPVIGEPCVLSPSSELAGNNSTFHTYEIAQMNGETLEAPRLAATMTLNYQ